MTDTASSHLSQSSPQQSIPSPDIENKPKTRSSKVRTHERLWEIDAARGVCLIGMVLFHTIFLLGLLGVISTVFWEDLICRDIIPGTNFQFIHLGTSLFVLICGFSLILRQRRMEGASRKAYNIAVVKRGVQVILVGVLFAVISSVIIYFFISDGRYMMFNFLMMMGCSMIIALPFVPLKKWAVIPAVLFIVLGFVLSSIHGPLFLMPLGILPGDYLPRDFFPIFPWVGIMLLGFALGSVLYPNGNRRFTVPQPNKFCRALATIGKYPLQIYVLHIPITAGIILLVCLVCSLLGFPITALFG